MFEWDIWDIWGLTIGHMGCHIRIDNGWLVDDYIPQDPNGAAILMVTWIPSIYPIHVSIYTSTMDPMGYSDEITVRNGSQHLLTVKMGL